MSQHAHPGPSSPGSEPGRFPDEKLHRVRIGRSFALATKAVTVEQFHKFLRAHPEVGHNYLKRYSPEPGGPITAVTWYEAAQYCRWLRNYPRTAFDPTETREKQGGRAVLG
jgi:formylglycine-generating enzyme required for sulfatase activity